MKSKWITYKGKEILYADYTGFGQDAQALKEEIDAAAVLVYQRPENSVLSLVDVRNTVGSSEALDMMKQGSARTKSYIAKMAVVGVIGVRRILADGVARFSGQSMSYFDTLEEAKEWLISG